MRDLDRAAFYRTHLGLRRAPVSPPHAVVSESDPASFAVREPMPGVDLDTAGPRPGIGVALWLAEAHVVGADVLTRRVERALSAVTKRPA